MKYYFFLPHLLTLSVTIETVSAATLKERVLAGSLSGNLRAHYNTRDYSTRTDEAGFALGGALLAETGTFGGLKLGLGYYTAQDLDQNSDNPARVNARLGVDVEVLGEAYARYSLRNTTLSAGRQKFNTPFANPGDAFIIPFTFNGYSAETKLTSSWTLKLDYFTSIKDRNSEQFVNVGEWSTRRYGVEVNDTSATFDAAAIYLKDHLRAEIWLIENADLFHTLYLQTHYEFRELRLQPFIDFQYGRQQETGDALLGAVESDLLGIQAGLILGKTKVSLGYNTVANRDDSFRSGAFLAPYSFSTSPLFTNNMVETVENVDSGDAVKATADFNLSDALKLKLSYASFAFDSAADRDAVDLDPTYNFSGFYQGLSCRWRIEVVTSDTDAVEQINSRLQLQLAF